MATGPGFPAQQNTFIPNWESSGRLIVGFSRNPKKFRIAQYAQLVPSPKTLGYYLKLTAQEAARVVNVDDYVWPDGADAPSGADGVEAFNFLPFTIARFAYAFNLGQMATEQADWSILEQHAQIHTAKAMTARTIRALSVLTTTANWGTAVDPDLVSNHTDTATNVGGGKWDVGTSTNPYIKKSLDAAAVLITKDTLAVIGGEPENFCLVVNPVCARLMAESAELHDYIKGSYWAQQEIEKGQSANARYGLPSSIYGYDVCVENCVKVTSRKDDTLAKSYALADTTAFLVSRPGGIEGVYGAPSFSTFTLFYWNHENGGELTIEQKYDVDNRRYQGRVVEATAEILTAPASGYLFTSVNG